MGENVISHRPATSLPCVDYFLFFLSLFERREGGIMWENVIHTGPATPQRTVHATERHSHT